jgi:hypothetical protein
MHNTEWFSWTYGLVTASVRLAEVVAVKELSGIGLVYIRGTEAIAIAPDDLAELKATLGIPK